MTPEQTAFARAAELTGWLAARGMPLAHVVLFHDGSGHLVVPRQYEQAFTPEIREHCSSFLASSRWVTDIYGDLTLASCGGFRG